MTDAERRAIEQIASSASVDDLRARMRNAKDKSPIVHRAAFDRLVRVSASDHSDPVARACREMVFTVEEIRRQTGRKVWKMQRLRPKIERQGEHAALEYCARNQTDGFAEVLGYGRPEFTAEALVLSFSDSFPPDTFRIARERLTGAGIDPDALPSH